MSFLFMPKMSRELDAIVFNIAFPTSNDTDSDGVNYGKSVFDVVRYPIFTSLDSKEMVKFV